MQICQCPKSTCDSCYQVTFGYCPAAITFKTLFPSGHTYYVWLQDKFGNVYNQSVVTASDGSFSLDFGQYPIGMFNNEAGFFYMYLTSDSAGENKIFIPYGVSPELQCIVFSIDDPVFFVDETDCKIFQDEVQTKYFIKG